jgi:hypothetical protein
VKRHWFFLDSFVDTLYRLLIMTLLAVNGPPNKAEGKPVSKIQHVMAFCVNGCALAAVAIVTMGILFLILVPGLEYLSNLLLDSLFRGNVTTLVISPVLIIGGIRAIVVWYKVVQENWKRDAKERLGGV